MTATIPAMRRCFFGVFLDEAARRAASSIQDALRLANGEPGFRWIAPEQMHLTLRFLGATDAARFDQLCGDVDAACGEWVSSVAAGNVIEAWPTSRSPRVVVAVLEAQPALRAIAAALERMARERGFPAETRGFRAHLTVARARPTARRFVDVEGEMPEVRASCDHVSLVESVVRDGVPSYVELRRWVLA